MTNIFVKHWRLIVLGLCIIAVFAVLYWLRIFVLPFAVGIILAYLLRPMVKWLETHLPPRRKWPGFRRVMAVLLCMLLVALLLAGFFYLVIDVVIDTVYVLAESLPFFLGAGLQNIIDWVTDTISSLPVAFQNILYSSVTGGQDVGTIISENLLGSLSLPSLTGALNVALGFLVLPFFVFYIMKDTERLKNGLKAAVPDRWMEHARRVMEIIEHILGRYIRAQLMLGLIVGYFSFVGMLLIGIDSGIALALALVAGVTELIPTLGPWIGGAFAGIVTLAMYPDENYIWWVLVLFVGVQLLENNLLVPKVQSAFLRIHPAVMLVLLVFGAYVAGFWGILLIGPVTALLVEIVKYIRECLKKQECAELMPPDAT